MFLAVNQLHAERPALIIRMITSPLHLSYPSPPPPAHREAAAKEQAAAHYQKMHAAGKTDQFKKDMERLAEVKRRREREAAERKAKEDGESTRARIVLSVTRVGSRKQEAGS